MGYKEALEAAGAVVHRFESFGSYEGDWWALVTYQGRTAWVHGNFGSCSYCDAFEGEFHYDAKGCAVHVYGPADPTCEDCAAKQKDYAERIAKFGSEYLDSMLTQEEAIAEASHYIEWDHDAKEVVAFLKKYPLAGTSPVGNPVES